MREFKKIGELDMGLEFQNFQHFSPIEIQEKYDILGLDELMGFKSN